MHARAGSVPYSLLLLALACGLGLPATGQVSVAASPPGRVTVRLPAGTVYRNPPRSGASLVTVWANTDAAGTFAQPLTNQQWVDWGDCASSGSDIVGRFSFGYGTTTPDSGLGLALCVDFYAGLTGHCTEAGQFVLPDLTYCLSGLPGATAGGTDSWIVTVELEGGSEFLLPPGDFGFGLRGLDGRTGPLLCYANGGSENAVDIYTPDVTTGTCATRTFGPPPDDYGSFWLTVENADPSQGPAALALNYNGTGVNPQGYWAIPPVLGEPWEAWAIPPPPNAGVILAGYGATLTLATAWGELLVDPSSPSGELLGLPFVIGSPAAFTQAVPIDLTLAGRVLYTQALAVGGGGRLLNGMALRVGF